MIDKPAVFDGKKWRDWSVVFRSYAGASNPLVAQKMGEATRSASAVVNASIAGEADRRASVQLFFGWCRPAAARRSTWSSTQESWRASRHGGT